MPESDARSVSQPLSAAVISGQLRRHCTNVPNYLCQHNREDITEAPRYDNDAVTYN